jgi:hypothetical protein
LHIHSDASYLSENEAKSRAGGFFYMGNATKNDKKLTNGAILIVSKVLKLLIPQVRQARKYPNSPWETIHPPGEIMQYVRDPTRSTRLGVPSHSQPLINTKYQIQVTNYLQTII